MKTSQLSLTFAFVIIVHLFAHGQTRTMESVYQNLVSHPEDAVFQYNSTLLSNQRLEHSRVNSRSNQVYVLDSILSVSSRAVESFQYDELDRLIFEEFDFGFGVPDDISYTYLEDSFLFDSIQNNFYSLIDGSLSECLKRKYNYDENDLVESILFTRSNFEYQQFGETRQQFVYDENSKVEEIILYELDEDNTETIIQRSEFVYDSLGRIEGFNSFLVSNSTENLNFRITYTYDEQNNNVLAISEVIVNGNVVAGERDEITLDDLGNLITNINTSDNDSFVIKADYDYNTERTRDDLVYPYASAFAPDPRSFLRQENQLLSIAREANGNGQINFTLYFWSEREVVTSTSEAVIAESFVYPNPVQDKMFIDNLEIKAGLAIRIYNLQGVEIMNRELLDIGQGIDVSSLTSGAYIFTLSNSDQIVYNGKFIKR